MNFSTKLQLVLFHVSIFLYLVNSSVPVKYTLPLSIQLKAEWNSDDEDDEDETEEAKIYNELPYPALILEVPPSSITRTRIPAIPNKCNNKQFDFPHSKSLAKYFLYYECQNGAYLETSTYYLRCRNELQLVEKITEENSFQISKTRQYTCKKASGKRYRIGYKGENTAMYTIYETCYLDEGKPVFTKHTLSSMSNLYCRDCYPPEVVNDFEKEMEEYENELIKTLLPEYLIEENNKLREAEQPHLIPFQLVPHDEMILYTWKIAAKNKMNYSLVWSNVAENSLKRVTLLMRRFMVSSFSNINIYTGVYEDENRGYPLYIWKIIRDTTLNRSFAVVIHNQPPYDNYTYEKLCESRLPCEGQGFGLHLEEQNISRGFTYCCTTTEFCENIPYLKDKFKTLFSSVEPDLQAKNIEINLNDPTFQKCKLPDQYHYGYRYEEGDDEQYDNAADPSNIASTSKPNDTKSFPTRLQKVNERIHEHYGDDILIGNQGKKVIF